MLMTIEETIRRVCALDEGIKVNTNWGEQGLFYNPDNRLPKGIYLLTFKIKDGDNDRASNINREGVYRLNLGIGKPAFVARFGSVPARPSAGQIVATGDDFTQLDRVMPHPVYGWMSWISVLNPSESTYESLEPLIVTALASAKRKFAGKLKKLK